MVSLRLLTALARLTENEREAFLDRHLCERSTAEIAETMGFGHRQQVDNLLRQARRKLAAETTRTRPAPAPKSSSRPSANA